MWLASLLAGRYHRCVNGSDGVDVLNVLWRSRQTAEAVEEVLAASIVPHGLRIRVVSEVERAEADKDWPTVLVDGHPSATLLSGASLTTVVVPYAGVSEYLRSAALDHPRLSVRNSHYNAKMVAQHATALLLAVANRVIPADAALRRGDWGKPGPEADLGIDLEGKRALLLGHGAIGKALAPTLASLGMSLVPFTRSGTTTDGLAAVGPSTWRQALSAADVVVCTLPATPETIGLVGAAELAALPRKAIVVNVGRGPVIDEDALYLALAEGRLFGAGLDVWYRYPEDARSRSTTLPANRPFHELDNVVMSPHRADAVEGWQRHAVADVLETLQDLRAGGSRNLVDLSRGY